MGYPSEVLEQVQNACEGVEAGLTGHGYTFEYEQQVELYQRIKEDHSTGKDCLLSACMQILHFTMLANKSLERTGGAGVLNTEGVIWQK